MVGMAARFPKRQTRRRTFIRQWREYRQLTQDALGDRIGLSKPQLSRIENGQQPYSQDLLEALAEALQTDVASLLMRDPSQDDAIWSIWEQAKPGERRMIEDLARTVVKTGTNDK